MGAFSEFLRFRPRRKCMAPHLLHKRQIWDAQLSTCCLLWERSDIIRIRVLFAPCVAPVPGWLVAVRGLPDGDLVLPNDLAEMWDAQRASGAR